MTKKKIMLPAVSVGLLVTGREAAASVIDYGLVAESLTIGNTATGTGAGSTVANTIGGYLFEGLTFVGPNLNQTISNNTVGGILARLLGPQGNTLTFDFLGNPGAAGAGTLPGATLALANNTVGLTENTVTATMTRCVSNTAGAGTLPGCAPGTEFPVDPYDPAGVLRSLQNADILNPPPSFSFGRSAEVDFMATITLGSVGGNTYIGEELVTVVNTPEPSPWSLAALGSALLAWWRRRR